MRQFAKSFQKDFEGQSLPLFYALDPEVGIGYYFQPPEKGNPLVETLRISAKQQQDDRKSGTNIHRFLLEQWHLSFRNGKSEIDLTEAGLLGLKNNQKEAGFLGASIIFRLAGEVVPLKLAALTRRNRWEDLP